MKTITFIAGSLICICLGCITLQSCSQENEYEEWSEVEYQTASRCITRSPEPLSEDPIEGTKRVEGATNKEITISGYGIVFNILVSWNETTTDNMCQDDITQHVVSSWNSNNNNIQLEIHNCSASWHDKTGLKVTLFFDILYPLENPMNGEITWVATPTSSNLSVSKTISIMSYLHDL